MAGKLALQLHRSLNIVGMAEQFVPFFASEFVPALPPGNVLEIFPPVITHQPAFAVGNFPASAALQCRCREIPAFRRITPEQESAVSVVEPHAETVAVLRFTPPAAVHAVVEQIEHAALRQHAVHIETLTVGEIDLRDQRQRRVATHRPCPIKRQIRRAAEM